jgi:hypothetical protein
VAHSLGTILAAHAVVNSDVDFQTVMLIQGALTSEQIEGGPLLDIERVNRLVITNYQDDQVLNLAAGLTGGRTQLGLAGYTGNDRDNVISVTFQDGGNTLFNHYGIEVANPTLADYIGGIWSNPATQHTE